MITNNDINATNLLNAYVEWGSDPDIIQDWDEEKAEQYAKVIENATILREINSPYEFADALNDLWIDGLYVAHIYSFVNGSEGHFCLDADLKLLTHDIPSGWNVNENDDYYFIDSRTGNGYSIYPKADYTFSEAVDAERNA